jgi:[ribosomal protein S18]-alanine N-acetyltransferase
MAADHRIGRSVTVGERRFQLREADQKDLGAMYLLECRSHHAPWSENALEDELTRRESRVWVLDEGERLAAMLIFWRVLDQVEILDVAVDPARQGLGLGRFLLDTLIGVARVQGIKQIALEVRVSNEVAIALYKKVGFEHRGRRPDYYEDNGEDAFVMVCDVGE